MAHRRDWILGTLLLAAAIASVVTVQVLPRGDAPQTFRVEWFARVAEPNQETTHQGTGSVDLPVMLPLANLTRVDVRVTVELSTSPRLRATGVNLEVRPPGLPSKSEQRVVDAGANPDAFQIEFRFDVARVPTVTQIEAPTAGEAALRLQAYASEAGRGNWTVRATFASMPDAPLAPESHRVVAAFSAASYEGTILNPAQN